MSKYIEPTRKKYSMHVENCQEKKPLVENFPEKNQNLKKYCVQILVAKYVKRRNLKCRKGL